MVVPDFISDGETLLREERRERETEGGDTLGLEKKGSSLDRDSD